MSIEPQHAATVHIPSVRPEAERTLADYQADLIRRFGRLPSWPELAKRENAARIRATGQTMWPQSAPDNGRRLMRTAEQEARRVERLRATLRAKSGAVYDAVLAALTKPMTMEDIANATGFDRKVISGHVSRMKEQGLLTKTVVAKGRAAIWQRSVEAAE